MPPQRAGKTVDRRVVGILHKYAEPTGGYHDPFVRPENRERFTPGQLVHVARDVIGKPIRLEHIKNPLMTDPVTGKQFVDKSPISGAKAFGRIEDAWLDPSTGFLHAEARINFNTQDAPHLGHPALFGPTLYPSWSLSHKPATIGENPLPETREVSLCAVPKWRGCDVHWFENNEHGAAAINEYKRKTGQDQYKEIAQTSAWWKMASVATPTEPIANGTTPAQNTETPTASAGGTPDESEHARVSQALSSMTQEQVEAVKTILARAQAKSSNDVKAAEETAAYARAQLFKQFEEAVRGSGVLPQAERNQMADRIRDQLTSNTDVIVNASASSAQRNRALADIMNAVIPAFSSMSALGNQLLSQQQNLQQQLQQFQALAASKTTQRNDLAGLLKDLYAQQSSAESGLPAGQANLLGQTSAAQNNVTFSKPAEPGVLDVNSGKFTPSTGEVVNSSAGAAAAAAAATPKQRNLSDEIINMVYSRDSSSEHPTKRRAVDVVGMEVPPGGLTTMYSRGGIQSLTSKFDFM